MRSTLTRATAALLMSVLAFGAFGAFAAPASAQGEYVSTTRFLDPAAPVPPTGDDILDEIQTRQAEAEAGDEVLGISATPASPPLALPELAFTGSSVNTPMAIGSTLIGAGGLLLLFARKREQQD